MNESQKCFAEWREAKAKALQYGLIPVDSRADKANIWWPVTEGQETN